MDNIQEYYDMDEFLAGTNHLLKENKCEKESNIYDKYSDYFGYEFFIMQKN